jgi:hypothetical protein
MNQWDLFYESSEEPAEEQEEERCRCGRPREEAIFARIHTPERLEACLVEARYTVVDLDATAALLDDLFERRADHWVDDVTIDGHDWPRARIWLSGTDKVNLETSTRETYERISPLIRDLPTFKRRTATREHSDGIRDHDPGYDMLPASRQRLHRNELGRPTPGCAEAVADLFIAVERRWLQTPHALLDGMSPEEAAKDEQRLWQVYHLLEFTAVRGRARAGLAPGTDLNRVRAALGIGRRW